MKLTLHLMVGAPGQPQTTADVAGDVLTVDGAEYDLSAVPEGGRPTPQGDHPFTGRITRQGGIIQAALIWRYDGANALPDQGSDPAVIEVTSGPVPDPVLRQKEAQG